MSLNNIDRNWILKNKIRDCLNIQRIQKEAIFFFEFKIEVPLRLNMKHKIR